MGKEKDDTRWGKRRKSKQGRNDGVDHLEGLGSGRNTLKDNLDGKVSVLLGDVERGNETEGLVDGGGQDEGITLERLLGDLVGETGRHTEELDTDHETQTADVDGDALGQHAGQLGAESRVELLGTGIAVLDDLLLVKDVEGGLGGGTGDGVTRVGTTHRSRGLLVHDLLARHDGRERVAGRDALGHDQDIGRDAKVLDGKELAGATKAGLDLVADHQDAVLIAQSAETLEETYVPALFSLQFPLLSFSFSLTGWGSDVATLALDGLDQDGGGVLGRRALLQQKLDLVEGLLGAPFRREAGRVGAVRGPLLVVREGSNVDTGHERVVTGAVDRLGGRQRHGAERTAVVRSLEHDDVLALGGVTGELDSSLNSLGATVPEEEGIELLAGHLGLQTLNEIEQGLLEEEVDLTVGQRRSLVLHSLDDLGMAMARVGDTNTYVPMSLSERVFYRFLSMTYQW